MVIDQPVREFLTNIPARRHLLTDNHLAESPSAYTVNEADAIWRQITETLQLMTPAEQLQLRDLLAREGISGFLARLGIASRNNRQKNGRVTCRCFNCVAVRTHGLRVQR